VNGFLKQALEELGSKNTYNWTESWLISAAGDARSSPSAETDHRYYKRRFSFGSPFLFLRYLEISSSGLNEEMRIISLSQSY
jgi:hypothetical protein